MSRPQNMVANHEKNVQECDVNEPHSPRISPMEQYRELCSDCRTRESHAWLIPGSSFLWTATLLAYINESTELTRLALFFLNALVYSSLFLLFYRWTRYQLIAQETIQNLLRKPEFANFEYTAQYFGLSAR